MKTPFDDGTVFVSRKFETDDGPVLLSIYTAVPYPTPEIDAVPDDPPWRCDYRIDFPGGETKQGYSVGIDGMQALMLAIGGARFRLMHVGNGTPERRPRIRWLASDDLGLQVDHYPADVPV